MVMYYAVVYMQILIHKFLFSFRTYSHTSSSTCSLFSRQVASLYILIPVFTVHLFLLPYKKLWQNILETAILVNYIILLLLRSTQTFLDNLASYSGTSVPAERGECLEENNRLTWFFFPFFYLPVFGGLAYCTGRGVYWLLR